MNLSLKNLFKSGGKAHWEKIYRKYDSTEVGWYQERPETSLQFIENTALSKSDKIIDVGGGESRLAVLLLDAGYRNITVLDISARALQAARQSAGEKAVQIRWIEADVTEYAFSRQFDLWHDRAVFHFLRDESQRRKYKAALESALKPGGHFIISTFSLDGPKKCSGLNVVRYDVSGLQAEIGANFELQHSGKELHHTPWGERQEFIWCWFQKIG